MNSGNKIVIGGIAIGSIILLIVVIVVVNALIIGFVVIFAIYATKDDKSRNQNRKLLKYSDKVKNYHGKNTKMPTWDSSKWYDENGKRIQYCDDSEKHFVGTKSAFLESDLIYVQEFANLVFDGAELTEQQYKNKIHRILNAKENKADTLIDIRYFFKNSKYTILPFHLTPEVRSNMILYYCQTRATKCVAMPKTKYSPQNTTNYLAYFPVNAFDDMCFIAYLMAKPPYLKGVRIHGFESGLAYLDLDKYEHDKDFVFEYIYRMLIDYNCEFFPMKNAFVETNARILKVTGYPDAAEYSSKQAEIKAEMQREGLIKSGLHNENERKLFFLVKETYPDAIYQYRDEWLGYYSLDIYIPSIKTAIEYQGGQHYKSVKFYGGKKTFADTQERDQNKRNLCAKKGIRLIEWNYETPINSQNLHSIINN